MVRPSFDEKLHVPSPVKKLKEIGSPFKAKMKPGTVWEFVKDFPKDHTMKKLGIQSKHFHTVTEFRTEGHEIQGKTESGWIPVLESSQRKVQILAYPEDIARSFRHDPLLKDMKASALTNCFFFELYRDICDRRNAISSVQFLPHDALALISSFLFQIYDASNPRGLLKVGDSAVIFGRRDGKYENKQCTLIDYNSTYEKFTVRLKDISQKILEVFASQLKPDVHPTHVFFGNSPPPPSVVNYFLTKDTVDLVMIFDPLCVELVDWKKIKLPNTLLDFSLFGTNFCGDLSKTQLVELDLGEVRTSDWKKTRFPPTLKKLNLSGSNFNGSLRDTKIEHLNLCRVHMDDWSDVFPPTLIEVNLEKTNFCGNFAELIGGDKADISPQLSLCDSNRQLTLFRHEGRPLKVNF